MSLIDEIVSVQITQADLGVNTASFDKLLILGDSKNTVSIKSYGSISEVFTDYTSNNPEYKAASLAFSQAVKPTKIMIGQVETGKFF